MPHYKYLIIGGGMTADSAARAIRELDRDGEIGLVSASHNPPYDRPPLSKGLWKGKPPDEIWRNTEELGVSLHLQRTVQTIEPAARRVTDHQGTIYSYERLLLATGGRPRRLPLGTDRVIYFRTINDYRNLRELAHRGRRFAVIGGGFIGSEIAAALAMNGKDVAMILRTDALGAERFPEDLSSFLSEFYRQKGVEVMSLHTPISVEPHGSRLALRVRATSGDEAERLLEVDGIVAGVGIDPNVELAQAAGLPVEDGIVVDELLRAGRPDIYAAGDVAAFFNPILERRIRVEHEDNANTMGRYAGRAMAGAPEPFRYLPFFYSDLFELGYEAVGEIDSRLETFSDWKEPYRKGVVYYLRDGRVRGVLLWNVWNRVDAARRLMAEKRTFQPEDLKGQI